MNSNREPGRRGELIGWLAFLVFVGAMFRLRRALDRR